MQAPAGVVCASLCGSCLGYSIAGMHTQLQSHTHGSPCPSPSNLWCRRRWLFCNQLRSLPPELGKLTGLKKLWLDRNQLEELPDGLFKDMSQLQVGAPCVWCVQSAERVGWVAPQLGGLVVGACAGRVRLVAGLLNGTD